LILALVVCHLTSGRIVQYKMGLKLQ